MSDKQFACVILAAGKGTRMKSCQPKVMHRLAGVPMLGHVLNAVVALKPSHVIVVVAPGMEDVSAYAAPHQSVIQVKPLGTAHAVQAAAEALKDFSGDVLVVFGDEPMVDPENLRRLLAARTQPSDPAIVMMGRRAKNPGAYGRLVMGPAGLERIVEALDASEEEKKIDLVWTGNLVADGKVFFDLLARIDNDNAKGEYYLTAIVAKAREAGRNCAVIDIGDDETIGINSRAELAEAEALMQKHLREMAMEEGATLTDPNTVYFSADTVLGKDVVIGPNVVFGPGVTIADDVQIKSFCHIEGTKIASGAIIGPFARLRPGTVIGKNAHIGNFVEIKNAVLHEGVKAGHLTYLGDAEIGAETNIGAGTITCNYDGFAKHKTTIGAGAFIGSDTALVAPVTVGDGAIIGAGSVITKDVPKDALAISRGQQRNLEDGARAFREKRRTK